jgi:hypothetical protein
MAIVPVPERGQPLDVTYIYEIVKSINDLYTLLGSDSRAGRVGVYTKGPEGPQDMKTSEAQIEAAFTTVSLSSLQTAGTSLNWYHNFNKQFFYPPIVTATAYNKEATDSGKDVTVTITSITTSKVEGFVKFNTGGETSIGINIIAVGKPTK